GKTRLAIAIADALRADYPDGVCFVSLGPIHDPALLAAAIAQTLHLQETSAELPRERVLNYLRTKRLLLLLDNFEQILAGALFVADILASCPFVDVLVTSREALHIRGEFEFPIVPLPLPQTDDDYETLSSAPAVELFRQRAEASAPGFTLTQENGAAVAAIC